MNNVDQREFKIYDKKGHLLGIVFDVNAKAAMSRMYGGAFVDGDAGLRAIQEENAKAETAAREAAELKAKGQTVVDGEDSEDSEEDEKAKSA